jgi:hypothetical protein
MRVVLGPLAKSGLETHLGPQLPAAIGVALVYYVGKLNSGQRPPRFPNFAPTQGNQNGDAETRSPHVPAIEPRLEVEVDVDERIEAALCTDAENQRVSVEDLAGHAVLVYLAELDLIGGPGAGPPGPDAGHAVPAGEIDSPPL